MAAERQMTTEEVAKLAGIKPASIRTYRLRHAIPDPDGYLGSTPWWWESTIAAWLERRPGPGRPRTF